MLEKTSSIPFRIQEKVSDKHFVFNQVGHTFPQKPFVIFP